MLQKALKGSGHYDGKIDGILGKGTVKALQKKAGVTQDGSWGVKTSKAVQKMVGTTVDGAFGPKSVKALQKWINEQNAKKKDKSAAEKRIAKGLKWLEEQTKKGYHYVNWDGSQSAKECPICHDHTKHGKYWGWNCIGLVSAYLYHGMGLKYIKCACNGFLGGNENYDKLLDLPYDKAQASLDEKTKKGAFKLVRKAGKTIKQKTLRKGDIVIYYKHGEFWHIAVYVGDGKIIDCSSSTDGVTRRKYKLAYPVKAAVRYIGK
jgi:hypothetical protein